MGFEYARLSRSDNRINSNPRTVASGVGGHHRISGREPMRKKSENRILRLAMGEIRGMRK